MIMQTAGLRKITHTFCVGLLDARFELAGNASLLQVLYSSFQLNLLPLLIGRVEGGGWVRVWIYEMDAQILSRHNPFVTSLEA